MHIILPLSVMLVGHFPIGFTLISRYLPFSSGQPYVNAVIFSPPFTLHQNHKTPDQLQTPHITAQPDYKLKTVRWHQCTALN